MACDHFPLIDELNYSEPVKLNYCRLTHPSHRNHLAYRRGLKRVAAGLSFAEDPIPVTVSRPELIVQVETPSTELKPAVAHDATYPPPGSSTEQLAKWSHARVHAKKIRANSHMAHLDLIRECDYRGEQLQGVGGGCGCTATWVCAIRKGPIRSNPFEVALSDCLRCVSLTEIRQ